MSRRCGPVPSVGIPAHALAEWRLLAGVLASSGPAPCERPGAADLWFPKSPLGDTSTAQAACLDCPAVDACARYALAAGEREGVWGATRPEERQR